MSRLPEAALSTGPQDDATGIAVSPHYLATQAGIDILREGGNAVDAAIAIDAVLGVVLPDTCGPGGDLFALIHEPGNDKPVALNASGIAGSGITADDMRDQGFGAIPFRSPWSITVPGCVDGWMSLTDRFARLPLSQSLRPAIDIAREGFPVSKELASDLPPIRDLIENEASAGPLFPGGFPATEGSEIRRPAFAATLETIGDGGRDAFYLGAVAAGIVAASDGSITPDDLAAIQSEWVSPASIEVFGRTAWTIPPNSQGYLTLATLWIFEHLDPPDDPNDPLYQHLLIEAYRSVAWERSSTVADPATAPFAIESLLSPDRLSNRADLISPNAITRWPVPGSSIGGTAYLTVRDASGMGVSFIQSNFAGIGVGRSAGGTGVWLHNRGAGFNLIQGHPNEYAPGKRPLHTLAPTLWTKDGKLDLLLGTRGGDQQPQFLAQFAANYFHAANCADDSQDLPRWNMEQPEPGTDSTVRVESRFAASTVQGLRDRGHVVTVARPLEPEWGPISAISGSPGIKGSADPRISTSSALAE